MTEIWERSFNDICDGVLFRESLTWRKCADITFNKWRPFQSLQSVKQISFRIDLDSKLDAKTNIPFLLRHDNCAFCMKAIFQSRTEDFGFKGRTCQACVLKGKCYDDSWLIKKMMIAIRAGDWLAFSELIQQAIDDVMKIIEAYEKEIEDKDKPIPI